MHEQRDLVVRARHFRIALDQRPEEFAVDVRLYIPDVVVKRPDADGFLRRVVDIRPALAGRISSLRRPERVWMPNGQAPSESMP